MADTMVFDEAGAALHHALHRAWTAAVGLPGYDKQLFRDLDGAIQRLKEEHVKELKAEGKEPWGDPWCNHPRGCSPTEKPEDCAWCFELNESDQLRGRMAALLTGVANALKGEPPPLVLHDWSDLPKVAAMQMAAHHEYVRTMDAFVAKKVICAYHEEDKGGPGEPCGTCLTCVQDKLQREREARQKAEAERDEARQRCAAAVASGAEESNVLEQ